MLHCLQPCHDLPESALLVIVRAAEVNDDVEFVFFPATTTVAPVKG
jgi:hypothetical protein